MYIIYYIYKMPYKDFQHVIEKEQLPDFKDNSECPICLQNIDLENNCVICENGHRMHRSCYFSMIDKRNCPICNGKVEKMCYGFNRILGRYAYSYLPRKGGKKKLKKYKIKTKKHRKIINKSKKNKITKKSQKK